MQKFTQIELFEKHLLASFTEKPARVHVILLSCPFEREFIAQGIIRLFEQLYPDIEVKRTDEGFLSLFSSQILYLLEEPKGSIPQEGWVIISSATGGKWEQEGAVILDLTKEKGWEREKRIKRYLLLVAKKRGRVIEPQALELLMKCANFGIMLREIEKLACYTEGKTAITSLDVETLTPLEATQAQGWKTVEAFVQGRGSLILQDPADFFPLIGQVRYLFQKEGNQRGLQELFNIEYLARTSYLDEQFLWNLFTLRYQHALDSSSE
ncbi:MAG: hypothetical protein KBC64_06010 [Simkaniaceae bacterium]|nr:hypothetical protein [Simkaniaceae bacterium]